MVRAIAVGTDGSNTATKAVDFAIHLAQRCGARLTLASEGEPADVLVKRAEEQSPDVLVVGNKGMQRRILGSVPNTVTHKAKCTVVVVKTT
jgi:nucleotide-binding universal stress UspA family protein